MRNPGPLSAQFETGFARFKPQNKEQIKNSDLRRHYSFGYDRVWDETLEVLHQYAVIAHISKQEGVISYIDIDGILLGKKLYYWEFPFTIYMEKVSDGTMVYVYPMEEIFSQDRSISSWQWWGDIKKGFTQKSEELLERISVQMEAGNRWPWLE